MRCPTGGRLTIETANAVLDDSYARTHQEVSAGQYVMVSVTDTGTGMSPDVAERAFEPFFTTKEVGRGSGLGLSMVYGFVKQSGGHAKIYSEPGEGTTVKLYFPRARASGPLPKEIVGPAVIGGNETILVVEDNHLVRGHLVNQLKGLGYRVIDAGNGPEALEILHQIAEIDLLLTDVVMPGGMSGRDLADAATALRPGLKVLFTSGYTDNAIVHQGRLDPGVHLLSKPYRRQELAEKVRRVLEDPPPRGRK
jgi:CheY-like chemotaxis protein